MYEFGRSMDSNKMESRDLLDAVPEKKYDCEPRQGSLLLNSGQLKRPTSLCRPSPDFGISRYSLASDIPETNCIKQHNLSSFIQRAHKFLRECSSSRILAVTGLFISIPIFIIDVALLLVLLIPHRQAIVSGLILGVGVLFCLLILIQNCYHWRLEKSRAESGLPVYDSYFSFPKGLHNSPRKQPELCTLV
ncbi:uncharacterized protein LOC106079629 isoform X2 [Biomphalaria glabrata]|uniref:Uncharacterized protein LOC106079629 isoform X2 n=1 Tax=Biomphalaria glabrata TaxID=6526 RepID=A0A9W2YQS8_BIOGL|nr:uncharacterized protein LOC106079629 isoform X2 [Biomphalaria glabrata]